MGRERLCDEPNERLSGDYINCPASVYLFFVGEAPCFFFFLEATESVETHRGKSALVTKDVKMH